ncbi:MAG: SPOR domain-containing protein, partial [Prevotellaceae bacterium]|nr:SPOR domain-containing protein [Prevotellaceae bacterium]
VVEKETIDAPTTTPTPATVPTKIATKNYHIIVGCFAKQNTAEKYANSLKNSNFPNASIIPSRKNTKVSIGAYPSENEAYTAMRELQQNTKLSAWVLETEQ